MSIARTGQLNERITVNQKKTVKINGVSQTKDVEIAKIWAAFRNQSIKDRINNIGEGTTNKVTFIVRRNIPVEITNVMTITHKNTTYQVKNVEPDTVGKEWNVIICEVIT